MSQKHAGEDRCAADTHSITPEKKVEVNSSSFPAPPAARQRRALKLEIPATTEWTEREGTCLGRRNCPFSASMHLFTVLYRAVTFSLIFFISSSFFPIHSSSALLSSRSSRSRFIPFFSARPCLSCVSMCVKRLLGRGCSACDESTPECRGAPNHVLAWPLNKLMFYGCRALPALPLLKGLHPLTSCL